MPSILHEAANSARRRAGEFLIGPGSAAIARGSSGRHADDERLDPALVIEQQRSTKCPSFIVGVSGNTKKFAHHLFG